MKINKPISKAMYFYSNILISIIFTILVALLLVFTSSMLSFISTYILLSWGIFFMIMPLWNSEALYYIVPYISYIIIFFIIHYILYSKKKIKLGYVYTVIYTIMNVIFGFASIFMMIQ